MDCQNFAYFRCFAIDGSGFIVIHNGFLEDRPMARDHIIVAEQQIAADLVSRNIMTKDTCVRYKDITNLMFWKVS